MMDNEKLSLEDELLLQAYLDDELSLAERQLVETRLAKEPHLTAVLNQWRTLNEELDTLPIPQLTHDLRAGVLAQLAPAEPSNARDWRPLLLGQIVLALVIALLAWPLWQLSLTLPTLSFVLSAWSELVQKGVVWWDAQFAFLHGWMAQFTAVLQGIDQVIPVSLSILLPLVIVMAVLWLVSVRFVWRSGQIR
jgi:anti-sigma factor RsiW